jgi:lambda family phage minor tail protein L
MTQPAADLPKLAPGDVIELFVLDCSPLGGAVYRFHNGVNQFGTDVVWKGNAYSRFPVEAEGFERRGQGTQPRPALRIANVTGLVGALARQSNDLVSAKVTRIRTLARYLDAVNFTAGNPLADPNVEISRDLWIVDRKSVENKLMVSFELAGAVDLIGLRLPRRQIIANACPFGYRSAECGYTGGAVATLNDVATTDPALDRCSKRLSGCKLRFGENGILNFGGFPAAAMMRST